jgi:hypothetical protein
MSEKPEGKRRPVLRAAGSLMLLAGVALLLFQILWPAQYRFPPAAPFTGEEWWNPYADYDGDTLRVCTHTHSRAWSGLTYGNVSAEEVYALYRDAGYDVACITNYLQIAPRPADWKGPFIPAYEHTLSLTKQHQTVMGPREIVWFDYPLWQGVRHKQEVIDRLKASAEVVILNHPNHFRAYPLADFDRLTGYDAVEVASRFAANLGYWDRALSAGRLVFGVAADDGHDTEGEAQYCRHWIDIDGAPEAAAFYEAFRAGRFYASSTRVPARDDWNALVSCRVEEGDLRVRMKNPVHVWRFIGQGGQVIRKVVRASEASLPLADVPGYVRVEAYTGGLVQYLNPVVRFDGAAPVRLRAEFQSGRTWFTRLIAAGLFLWVASLLLVRRRR